ncbi:MAG: DUF3152 domain-containing protein [Propionibacteriaceae bacterium]|nr:DUF3152 domain-containing protein [Propionibacteriaceae bacterium]
MTEPTPPSRWRAFRSGLARRRLNPFVIVSVVLGIALVAALAVWANALTTPVHREGLPTTSVTPLPAPTTATPTPTPSASGTESPTAEPTETGPAPSSGPTIKASGKFDTAGVNVAASGSSGKLRRYAVQVETSAKQKADKVGTQIAGVLNDPRSWAGSGNVRFALVADIAKADFTIVIAAPATAKGLCKPEPSTCVSSGDLVIDASAWLSTPGDYPSRAQWQAYLVNHVVGHLLGESHQDCSKQGRPAPVMMPQEAGLRGCTPNPWPFP